MTKREKHLLVMAAVIFSASLLLFGFHFLVANNFFQPEERVLLSDMKKSEILVRTQKLREKLRPWAQKHQVLLKQLLRSNEKDLRALDRVWQMSPILVSSSDKSDSSRLILLRDLQPPVMYEMLCGSKAFEKRARYETPLTREEAEDMAMGREKRERRKLIYWRKFRDVVLICSVNPGREKFALWVSGRITKQIVPKSFGSKMRRARTDLMEEVSAYEELEPPFEFLR